MNLLKSSGRENMESSGVKLYVRYMVCLRCKMLVKSELEKLGIQYSVTLKGGIEFPDGISHEQRDKLKKNLQKHGLYLLDESESLLIDKIIDTIIEVIHHTDRLPKICYNELIHKKMGRNSESILRIFSEVTGVSITQFIIDQKIDRAKELLLYYDLAPAEISKKLNYSNKNLFIAQFKKFTGLTPSYFMEVKNKRFNKAANQ